MTPILYEKDEIDFTSQGLGSLVEIYDVDVEEQRNGLLQLTASYPVSGVRYADISVGRIILAKPNQRDDIHAFRIVSTELDISGYAVTIEADSITYDLTHNLVKHLVVSGNGQAFMTALKNVVVNPSIFAFYSDIATSSTTTLNYVNPMEAIMGTTGSFLQIWGGELKRENRRVAMFNRRGRDNVSTFRLGKNISGLKYSVDISSLVTRIIPTKSVQNDDQTATMLEGTPVDSQYINNYEQIYTLPLEFTDESIKTVADLNAAAKGWFTQSANTGRDKPTVTIDIDVLSLQDSADYQDKFKNLESVSLTDTVTVYVPEYGVNVTAIVNELHYDPILDRVTKMTVGTAKQSFADSSRTQLSDLQDKIISVQNQADAAAVSANGKSTNYYGSVEPSHPQEGDTWFWVNGDKSGVKVFVNGEWVEPVDSDTQEKIAAGVTEAVAQANAHTDEVKQGLSTDIATAKSQAASQASTAEANAKSAATSQFNQAQSALLQAKSDINDTINAISVGGRNYLLNSDILINTGQSSYINQSVTPDFFSNKKIAASVHVKYNNVKTIGSGTFQRLVFAVAFKDSSGNTIYLDTQKAITTLGESFDGIVSATVDLSGFSVSSVTDCALYIQNFTADYIEISNPKLEIGNKATDWSPAPEDVVLDYTTKDNQIKATITQYQTTNDGKVAKAQTDATTALGLVATKVSQTDYDTKTGQFQTDLTSTTQTANQAKTDIVSIKQSDTSQDARMTQIESDASGTKQTVSNLQTVQGQQSGSISTLQQRADGFDATVTKVDNLAVGGRNLLLNSATYNGVWTQVDNLLANSYQGLTATQDNKAWSSPKYSILSLKNRGVINENDTYVYSTWLKNTSSQQVTIRFYGTDNNTVWVTNNNTTFAVVSPNSDWVRFSTSPFKFINLDSATDAGIRVESWLDLDDGYIMQAGTKLEKGTIATDWTPAPEDIESALTQVKITADGISNFVRDSSGNISSDFQTALSKTSIITGSTLATSIQKQTATQITQAISDNNSNIISMINLDTSGVQIAGKNIILDGTVTATSAFWAKQVNAVQVNASNMTTGTLNAANVNIVNLDVNSLTGNVSNFIQSNWNGEYSSTKISSTGMQIGGFSANGFDTIFDKTGTAFETTDARYGYAIAHYGTDTITNSSGQVMARGMEIRTGNENGIGFDYFAIKSPGANNLEFGKTTNAGHVSIAVVPDTNLMPIFNQGITILDDVFIPTTATISAISVKTINGSKGGDFFTALAGKKISIPTSMNSNGTVGSWATIQL